MGDPMSAPEPIPTGMPVGDPDPIPTGTPVPEEPPDPIERLRSYVLQKLLRGVPRGQIEDELIAKGYDVQYSIQLVASVTRNAERKGGSSALLDDAEVPELPPAVQFEEAREQIEAMAVFKLAEENAVLARRKPRHNENARRLFSVLYIIGLALLLGGLITEWQFWFVFLTGGRARGVVTLVEDRVVLRPYTRGGPSEGKGYDLKATYVEYTFPTPEGHAIGYVWLDSTSKDWETGTPIDVMYSRLNAGTNMPSSLPFRVENDTVWFMAQLACVLGIVLTGVGFLGRRGAKS
jgi:hypothetical protein